MLSMKKNPLTFRSGFVQNRNIGRVIAVIDEISDQGSDSCQAMKWVRDSQEWSYFLLEWAATRILVLEEPQVQLFITGPDGIVLKMTADGESEEHIDNSDEGLRARGPARDLRYIGSHIYMTGMGRQVYRREGDNNWIRFDQGIVRPIGSTEICGFNSIDGLTEKEIYAVGFKGEIWRYLKNKWQPVESPTNLVLHCVRAVDKDLVFVSGQKGLLIKGSGNRWELIDHDATNKDIWSIEWYNEQLYAACDDALFVYKENNQVDKVDTGLGDKITSRYLHSNDGVLWSFGPKNIIWTEDGIRWNEVTPGMS
jgi:hypothetical protein